VFGKRAERWSRDTKESTRGKEDGNCPRPK